MKSQPHKYDDLSSSPRPHVRAGCSYPVLGRLKQEDTGGLPSSLASLASCFMPFLNERPCLKTLKWRMIKDDMQH